jgi:quinol monooxygenase YgiN
MARPDSKSRRDFLKTTSIVGLSAAFNPATIRDAFAFSKVLTPQEENTMAQTNPKVIMLIEARIQPQRRAELIEAARQYLPLVRSEPGVEAFYLTARQDDPNTLVFYEVYRSQASQDFHLQQDFTKKFLATLKSAQAADRVRTNLVEVAEQAQAQAN